MEKQRDRRGVLSDAREVLRAAWEGRVSHLLVAEGAAFRGAWNAGTGEIDEANPREDLLNAAALRTVLDDGQAFVLPRQEMPGGQDVAAVLRY